MSIKSYAFLLFFLFLGGCRSVVEDKVKCPKTVFVAEHLKVIDLQKGIPIHTEFDGLRCGCVVEDSMIVMDLHLRLTSLRPFLKIDIPVTTKLSYFVAVVDERGNILSRTNHEIDFTFEEKKRSSVNFQHLQEVVPLGNASVYIGFNLNEDQMILLEEEKKKKFFGYPKLTE